MKSISAKKGIVFKIKKYAIHDGPGIRTTIFLKGCPLKCWWCHNPEGQKKGPQISKNNLPEESAEIKNEIYGEELTVKKVISEIEKDLIFYDDTGGGVTMSGGEPLAQPEFLYSLLKACFKRDIHTALDTTGYAPIKTFMRIVNWTDLILYDLKIMNPQKHLFYTGVSNSLIHANLRTLVSEKQNIHIRFPVIPQITDGKENIKQMAEFICSLKKIDHVDILPFHQIADAKYVRLGMENKMKETTPPPGEKMEEIKSIFEKYGFKVKIGG